jgi:L-ascorbate metabolism protein UlaG (beta-lactamase superfamily)
MKKGIGLLMLLVAVPALHVAAEADTDVFPSSEGTLEITFVGHGTLMFGWDGWIVHVDPVSSEADYDTLPKADLVLITHEHRDHLDQRAVSAVTKQDTVILANESSANKLLGAQVLRNGEQRTIGGVRVEAVAAYNTTSGRERFHPKGRDNGYILTFGTERIYVAGDTEDTPEMKALTNIAIAFLPMNQPFTMTPEQVAAAARAFRPRILYPYHFGNTDMGRLTALLADVTDIEIRLRDLR